MTRDEPGWGWFPEDRVCTFTQHCFLRQHLASTRPCPGDTELLKFSGMKFSKCRKHSLGSATLSFSYSSFNPRFFLQGKSLQGPSGNQTESGKCLICWPQKRCSFHTEERSVKKKSFTSHEKKVPAQDLTAIPRGSPTLLLVGLKPSLPPLGQLRWPWTFSETKIHTRWEGRQANTGSGEGRILTLPTQDPSSTSPPDFTVWPQASVFPSLGFCKTKMGPNDHCTQAQTPPSLSWPSPNYPRCTVNHSLPKYQTPTTTTLPSSPAVQLLFPIDLPRAWNKLPIICIMLHDSSLYTSNHFSISFCKIHQE